MRVFSSSAAALEKVVTRIFRTGTPFRIRRRMRCVIVKVLPVPALASIRYLPPGFACRVPPFRSCPAEAASEPDGKSGGRFRG